MLSRWKGKAAKAKALANPMSETVSKLRSALIESKTKGLLSGSSVLIISSNAEQNELLNKACFGRPIVTNADDNPRFQLSPEEAFYMCRAMKCIEVADEKGDIKSEEELWDHMTCQNPNFPFLYKAYSHLRSKNWVVRQGSQFGVDFVAYSHHPSLVHSEYAVLVLSDHGDMHRRLTVWSDFHCTLRLCGSVAKTLLVLHIIGSNTNGAAGNKNTFLSSLDTYVVEERVVKRWNPKQSREGQSNTSDKSC